MSTYKLLGSEAKKFTFLLHSLYVAYKVIQIIPIYRLFFNTRQTAQNAIFMLK